MAVETQARRDPLPPAVSVETMRTLIVCRGPIAFEALEVYRRCHWQLPHVVVSAKEWIAERQRTAPWIAEMPPDHVHYIQEYDDIAAILQIAQAYQIDAIYPGYGFLAESATFAEHIRQAGLRFIGPTPEALRLVGDKDTAIALANHLGLPTIPSDDALIAYARLHGQEETVAETVRRVLALGRQYPGSPIRLKHPAGGGGKGQRVLSVHALQAPDAGESIREALAKVWAEMGVSHTEADARKGVLLEINLPRPLHWEVQLLGDGNTVVHLAARDCSLQNHASQKFIELALSPESIAQELRRLDPQRDAARMARLRQRQATLEQLCTAAVRLGSAIRLCGTATVEFLIDPQGAPYFLEVNPRIQVEHAVTEGIARVRGRPISLVEWQQRVAAGETLDFQQSDITFTGDALEVRLNAWYEDLSPVLGGVIHTLHLDVPPALRASVRLDAGGLLQRHAPWCVPSYDANFALLIVTGRYRHETMDRMRTVLETALQIDGNPVLHTNLQPVVGLLTLMQACPSATEFRIDTSLLWMAWVAIVVAHKDAVLSRLPDFPHRPEPHHPARFARLLRATVEAALAHPSRLLAYYLKRLAAPTSRPLTALEVLWQLAEELAVPLFEEERQHREALHAAVAALWSALAASCQRYTALLGTAAAGCLEGHPDYGALCTSLLQATDSALGPAEAGELLGTLLGWLTADIPAITALLKAVASTQIHTCLTEGDDLSLPRPTCMEDEAYVARLHRFLRSRLRPVVLRHDALLSPMEATIYHHPEPGAPPFVQIGAEVHVGQTLALLEAMKMFTELTSPVDGKLVDILVESGQGVKTGTPLFKIVPQDPDSDTTDDVLCPIADGAWQQHCGLLWLPEALEVPHG